MKYNLLGAFDRHNYGDILFGLIHSNYIKQHKPHDNLNISYYATKSADLESVGGYKTSPFNQMFKNGIGDNEKIVVCGGEVLPTDWITMQGHVSSPLTYMVLKLIKLATGPVISNKIVQKITGQYSQYPFIIPEDHAHKTYYISVGGAYFPHAESSSHLKKVAKILSNSALVTVRDNRTQKNLSLGGLKADISPDSALIMSDQYPKEILEQRSWKNNISNIASFNENKYFVFQSARRYAISEVDFIAKQLFDLHKTCGASILLLPIGRATGHEDQVVLEKIHKKLNALGAESHMQNSAHVLDIMASIAFSQLYIGTSLHGAITAHSYNVKVCGVHTQKVKKLASFLETWKKPEDYRSCQDFDFFNSTVELHSTNKSDAIEADLHQQKNKIYASMSKYL